MNRFLLRSIITLVSLTPVAAITSNSQNLLSIKDTISDSTIVYPESFETDTHKMMQNWYLQNYIVLNDKFSASTADESDEAYIKRLAAIPTTIEMPYNQIVRQYINMYTQRRRQLVENMLGMSLYYLPIFEAALERHGVPLELRYLPVIESAMNPDAVSRVGATGLWQFMLPTARGLGLEINTLVDERRDPYASSDAAARYLKQLYGMYNDWSLAIAAYNCGPGNINKAIRRAGVEKPDFWAIYYCLPQETRGYFPAFIAANYVMTYYNLHGISPALARRPIVTDSVHVDRRIHFNQIAEVLNMPVEEIRVLNPQFRHDLIPGNTKPYSLVLPSMQVHSFIMSIDTIAAYKSDIYGRRLTVEPTTTFNATGGSGEYTTKLVVKTHVVKKKETFASIARKYGVTVNELKSWNGIKKSTKTLQRGRRLKIHTYERVPVVKPETPAENEQPAENTSPAPADTTATTTDISADSPAVTHEQPEDTESDPDAPTVMPFSGLDDTADNDDDTTVKASTEPAPRK
ncbi:MAG: transglycosylase SLT domain-containing protein, partial [Muribaculum sp.]|nr:transglycosylase SLT domain-containing protein [Muribaculum sp.]